MKPIKARYAIRGSVRPPRPGLRPLALVRTRDIARFLDFLAEQHIRSFVARRQRNGKWGVGIGWDPGPRQRHILPGSTPGT